MNLIFLIGFGYICFNQLILKSTGKIENGNISVEIFKSIKFPSYGHTEHKTQLMDLNTDCLFLVLNHLDLNSLLSITEAHIGLNSLVLEIVKKIFRKKEFQIVMEPFDDSNRVRIGHDYIQTTSFNVAERVFKNFGHLIEKIYNNYEEMNNATRSIYKLVNLHCSKTLKEIILEKSMNNFLDEFTNQFENVQEVLIGYSLETNRRLNEVFPSVRRLHLQIYDFLSTDSINVKYMNLEHLKIFVNEGPLTEELAAELIKKNSHIRSLALDSASVELIKIAADLLPQLEGLKLEDIRCKNFNELISFANVKIFEIERCYINSLLSNIKFGNVEELHTDDLADSMFGETGFFASNTKLKKLQLGSDYEYYHVDALKKLAHANSTLQDIFISRVVWVKVEPILQLIENNKQLQKLQIMFDFHKEREIISKDLSRKIGDKWNMEAFSDTIILKKNHILF